MRLILVGFKVKGVFLGRGKGGQGNTYPNATEYKSRTTAITAKDPDERSDGSLNKSN
jgi:hypothetical protein